LAAIFLATVPVTPVTFVKFDFKFANPSKSYEITKQEYADLHLLYGETRSNSRPARRPYGERFPEGVLPRLVVLLWSYICIYVRLVLTDSNTMASPILHLTPLDFNFRGHTKDLVYEVEINTKSQLQKRVTDAANQISKNPEMLNSVYENWYQRTQMCLNANGRQIMCLV
jgi:hypothetical protein